MASIEKILEAMRKNPNSITFADCLKVCTHYFGKPRVCGSHHVFKTPWEGEPWVNVQEKSGAAKPYQIRQALDSIDKLERERND